MKILKRILMGVVCLVVLALILLRLMFGPISAEQGTEKIENSLDKFVEKYDDVNNVLLRVYSESNGYDKAFASGTRRDGKPLEVSDRYESASVGKTMTVVLAMQLYEKGQLDIHDPIIKYLDVDLLEGLFVYDGIDYKDEVTIYQLMRHESGVADFFEGEVINGSTMIDEIKADPDHFWTPYELLSFTRERQLAIGKPGETFNYSDTGYVLLGLVLENVKNQPLHELYHELLFEPLGMHDTSIILRSEPKNPPNKDILEFMLFSKDYSKSNVLSIDWAGGGVVSTTEDLLTFSKALYNGEIISIASVDMMRTFDSIYLKGIKYGMGMMAFDFSELSPMLSNMPDIYGGVGASATYMMYDDVNDTFIIFDIGSLDRMEDGVRKIIEILMIYDRIEHE